MKRPGRDHTAPSAPARRGRRPPALSPSRWRHHGAAAAPSIAGSVRQGRESGCPYTRHYTTGTRTGKARRVSSASGNRRTSAEVLAFTVEMDSVKRFEFSSHEPSTSVAILNTFSNTHSFTDTGHVKATRMGEQRNHAVRATPLDNRQHAHTHATHTDLASPAARTEATTLSAFAVSAATSPSPSALAAAEPQATTTAPRPRDHQPCTAGHTYRPDSRSTAKGHIPRLQRDTVQAAVPCSPSSRAVVIETLAAACCSVNSAISALSFRMVALSSFFAALSSALASRILACTTSPSVFASSRSFVRRVRMCSVAAMRF